MFAETFEKLVDEEMCFIWYFEPGLYKMKHSYVCSENDYVTNVKSDVSSCILFFSLDPRVYIYIYI